MEVHQDNYSVSIPDEKFREILKEKYGLLFDLSETIAFQDIKEIRDLEVSNSKIASLEGIEFFSSLQVLGCGGNSLTSLNISKNSELEKLNCHENNLKELDISQNINLQVLVCNSNEFESLNVSQNLKLRSLYCEKEIEVHY